MEVILSPRAEKYLERMNEPARGRVKSAMVGLGQDPPQGDITALTGRGGFRLRVGGYRVLFGIKDGLIVITNIAPRGQVYK
jgi:mRNA interferase RelE/StbE